MPKTRDQYVCLNGQFLTKETHEILLHNRAFLYGDGFFETIFTSGTRIPFLSKHFERITRAVEQYRFIPDETFTRDQLREDITGLIHRNKSYFATKIRVTFYRNHGGLYTPESQGFSYLMSSERLPHDGFELNKQGYKIDTFTVFKKNIDPFSAFKNIASQLFIQAGIHKKENGLDECILLNTSNEICETISSNIFLAVGKQVLTPALSTGCVNGVMRKTVIELLMNNGYKVKECVLEPEDLLEAEEIFITNAISGVRWVGAFKTKRYYNFVSKFLIRALNRLLENADENKK